MLYVHMQYFQVFTSPYFFTALFLAIWYCEYTLNGDKTVCFHHFCRLFSLGVAISYCEYTLNGDKT